MPSHFVHFNAEVELREIKSIVADCVFCKVKKVSHEVKILKVKNLKIRKCRECEIESFYLEDKRMFPNVSYGLPLPELVPNEIKKEFDEARAIAEKSVRCANILIRSCTELILMWIVEKRLPEKFVEFNGIKSLGGKIGELSKCKPDGINTKLFDMLSILSKYGNDNAHSIKEIDDSDTFESFETLYDFIHSITESVLLLNLQDEKVQKMKNKISNKNKV